MPTTLLSLLKKHKRSFLYKLLVPRELQNQLYDFSLSGFLGEFFTGLPPGLLPRKDSLCTLEPSPFVRYTALCSTASFRTNFPSRRFSVEMNIIISREILQMSPLNCFFKRKTSWLQLSERKYDKKGIASFSSLHQPEKRNT